MLVMFDLSEVCLTLVNSSAALDCCEQSVDVDILCHQLFHLNLINIALVGCPWVQVNYSVDAKVKDLMWCLQRKSNAA